VDMRQERTANLEALANPNAVVVPSISGTKAAAADEEEQVRYLISTNSPYAGLTNLADQLSTSKLTWNDQVNHLFLLMYGRYPTVAERSESNSYLEFARQDGRQALILIATTHLGSF
jgi:hypothetical protein